MRDNDDGYVHDPDAFDEHRDQTEDEPARTTKAYLDPDERSEQTFDRRGWLLVATLTLAFVVVPASILYLPHIRPSITALGLTFRDAYLVLPLVPALVLGTVAVWTAVSGTR